MQRSDNRANSRNAQTNGSTSQFKCSNKTYGLQGSSRSFTDAIGCIAGIRDNFAVANKLTKILVRALPRDYLLQDSDGDFNRNQPIDEHKN